MRSISKAQTLQVISSVLSVMAIVAIMFNSCTTESATTKNENRKDYKIYNEAPKATTVAHNYEEEGYTYNDQERATIKLFERAKTSVAFITTSNLQRDRWSRDLREIKSGTCLLYTSPSPRDATLSRMPSSA